MNQATDYEEQQEALYRAESLRRWSMQQVALQNQCQCVGQFVCKLCKGKTMTDGERSVVEMMQKYGGSFVRALAHAMLVADPINFAVLKDAFPSYWNHYAALRAEGQRQVEQLFAQTDTESEIK